MGKCIVLHVRWLGDWVYQVVQTSPDNFIIRYRHDRSPFWIKRKHSFRGFVGTSEFSSFEDAIEILENDLRKDAWNMSNVEEKLSFKYWLGVSIVLFLLLTVFSIALLFLYISLTWDNPKAWSLTLTSVIFLPLIVGLLQMFIKEIK